MHRTIVGCLAALAVLAFALAPVAAQEGTPSVGAASCDVEPYDLTTVLQPTAGTPAAEATPDATALERPTGEPADAETVAAVTETIDQFVGCFNLGYRFRTLYLFTPDYLPAYLAQVAGPLTAEQIAQINELASNTEPVEPLPPEEQTLIHSIEDVQVLDDGRVVATVIGDDLAEEGGPNPVDFIFEEVDGRYLIDGVIDPQPEGTPEA